MFGVDSSELLVVAVIALVVIGPKELPRMLRIVGYWVGKARGTVRQFRAGIDDMIRESELQEMEKKWRAENERILKDFPNTDQNETVPYEAVHYDADPLYPDNADGTHAPVEHTAAAEEGGAPELPLGPPAQKDGPKADLP
jgi:sec-independent protein translocase protein TatB